MTIKTVLLKKLSDLEIERLEKNQTVFFTRGKGLYSAFVKKLGTGFLTRLPFLEVVAINQYDKLFIDKLYLDEPDIAIYSYADDSEKTVAQLLGKKK